MFIDFIKDHVGKALLIVLATFFCAIYYVTVRGHACYMYDLNSEEPVVTMYVQMENACYITTIGDGGYSYKVLPEGEWSE